MTPSASIVVPSRGGAERLPKLLDALDAQTTTDFEVIVVIDGDIDGSTGVVEARAATAKYRLRAITFPENRGRVAALNTGFDAATAELFIRTDDDLRPAPDYVERHLAAQAGGPQGTIGLYANVLPPTSYARVYGVAADRRFRRDALATPPERQWRYWAGNVSVPREVHEGLGGYDARYRTYGWEDIDFGYRVHRAGVPVRIVPELTTPHHVAATTTAVRALRALHSGAARATFVDIHGAAALGPAHEPGGWWGALVRRRAARVTEASIRQRGERVDRLARIVPRVVGEKLIALEVEAASLAGIRDPALARANF